MIPPATVEALQRHADYWRARGCRVEVDGLRIVVTHVSPLVEQGEGLANFTEDPEEARRNLEALPNVVVWRQGSEFSWHRVSIKRHRTSSTSSTSSASATRC